MSDVLDLAPLLKRKAASQCKHEQAEVDDNAASLTCEACGAELDPWWFLRRIARDAEGYDARRARQHAEHVAWCKSASEKIQRLHKEITELVATKNRLWNEQVNGAPLGTLVRRRRRKA